MDSWDDNTPWYENFDVIFWSWIAVIYVAVIVGLIFLAEAVT